MKTTPSAVASVPRASGTRSPGDTFADRLRAQARQVRMGWLQVFGIPDYDRYLSHRAAHHPGDAVLSRREFFAQAIDRKYCRSGPRCC